MGRSRNKVYEPTHPHFLTCTIFTEGTGERNRTIICPQIALAHYDILSRNRYKT